MLVLKRTINEVLCIGEDVTVKVVSIEGGQVKLGIMAPPEVAIDREEVRKLKSGKAYEDRK